MFCDRETPFCLSLSVRLTVRAGLGVAQVAAQTFEQVFETSVREKKRVFFCVFLRICLTESDRILTESESLRIFLTEPNRMSDRVSKSFQPNLDRILTESLILFLFVSYVGLGWSANSVALMACCLV